MQRSSSRSTPTQLTLELDSGAFIEGARSRDLMAGVPSCIPALLVVAAVYFVVFLRQRNARTLCIEADDTLRPIYSWAGAFAVALVMELEVRPTLVGPAWMILALLLIEAGMALGEPHLRGPGYVAALAATVAVLALSAPSHERLANIATRTPALLFVAAAYLYLFLRQRRARADRLHDFDRSLRPLFSWAGTALAALLVWLEAPAAPGGARLVVPWPLPVPARAAPRARGPPP